MQNTFTRDILQGGNAQEELTLAQQKVFWVIEELAGPGRSQRPVTAQAVG